MPTFSRNYIYNKIVVSLGARAAEIIIFGSNEVTQGSQKDLEDVYFWANQMVTRFGFSELGPIGNPGTFCQPSSVR